MTGLAILPGRLFLDRLGVFGFYMRAARTVADFTAGVPIGISRSNRQLDVDHNSIIDSAIIAMVV